MREEGLLTETERLLIISESFKSLFLMMKMMITESRWKYLEL